MQKEVICVSSLEHCMHGICAISCRAISYTLCFLWSASLDCNAMHISGDLYIKCVFPILLGFFTQLLHSNEITSTSTHCISNPNFPMTFSVNTSYKYCHYAYNMCAGLLLSERNNIIDEELFILRKKYFLVESLWISFIFTMRIAHYSRDSSSLSPWGVRYTTAIAMDLFDCWWFIDL